jgi:hypothetical protein
MAHTTEIRTLLAAARRGDFTALLAAADYWQEHAAGSQANEFSAFNWDHLLRDCRRYIASRDSVKMGVLEATSRRFRDFAYSTNDLFKCWRLPRRRLYVGTYRKLEKYHAPGIKAYVRAWDWCRDMADQLIRHVKALDASRAPTETDS